MYPAHTIAMGAVFLAVLQLNCLPIDPSNRDSERNHSKSVADVALAWFDLLKNDISLEELMGNDQIHVAITELSSH